MFLTQHQPTTVPRCKGPVGLSPGSQSHPEDMVTPFTSRNTDNLDLAMHGTIPTVNLA